MSKTYIIETKEAPDGSGDLIIELPQELLNSLEWKEGDVVDGKIVVKKVLDISKEEKVFLEKLNQNKDLFSKDMIISRSEKYK